VTATSSTTGTATVKNNSKNQQVTHTLSSTYTLCQEYAEWIVEDYKSNGVDVPLADWGTVTFTNAYATGPTGTTYGADNAQIVNMVQNGDYLTDVSSAAAKSVTIKYAGP
jgi:hypothetical protein